MNAPEKQDMGLSSSMYHQLLAQHDIYFVAFDAKEQIVASNYPVATLTLERLDDLVFLVGPNYSAQIRAFLRHEREALAFDVANLHFSMSKLRDADTGLVYCLQIEAKEKPPTEPKLSAIELDYQIIHELTESLSLLSQSGSMQLGDNLQQEIRTKHLPEVERRLSQLQDPSLKMCLEIVKTNMENLLQNETSAINSKLLEVLTPSELQVAEFIRSGMSSQEIASTLNVARKTVENHRNSLRNKLGITNRGVNLRNYLLSLEKR